MAFHILLALLMATAAYAEDFDNPLDQGRVIVKGQAAPDNPDTLNTASLGVYRKDTGERLFCVDALPGALVEGQTDVINKKSGDIFLVFVAHTGPACADLQDALPSEDSADRYRVRFGRPGRAITNRIIPSPL